MKIIPLPGYALVQQVKKDSSFFNRAKLLAVKPATSETAMAMAGVTYLLPGDIVILSPGATQLAVPGKIKNESGQWIEVLLVAIHDIVGKIEGDTAEEVVQSSILTGTSEKMN